MSYCTPEEYEARLDASLAYLEELLKRRAHAIRYPRITPLPPELRTKLSLELVMARATEGLERGMVAAAEARARDGNHADYLARARVRMQIAETKTALLELALAPAARIAA
ncbi:MAG: hypothetical protein JWN04_100 [Myxococcaceae bacterium]|nr:hypothetical protein [Myxococcaceae bacterium]